MRHPNEVQPIKVAIPYQYNLLKPTFSSKSSISQPFTEQNSSGINFDAHNLFELTVRVTPVAIRVYMALLTRLICNDKPVYCTVNTLKADINDSKKSKSVERSIKELEREKAIFRQRYDYNNFYINPLFAWTGDRVSYFDASTLPLLPEED